MAYLRSHGPALGERAGGTMTRGPTSVVVAMFLTAVMLRTSSGSKEMNVNCALLNIYHRQAVGCWGNNAT